MATSRKTKPIDPARPARSRGLTARVVVKFHDYVQLPYVDGVEKYIEEYQIAPWQNLAQAFPGLRMRRLFTALKPERIGELVRQAVERDSTYLPPNFFTYFTVICPPGVDPQRVAKELSAWEAVEQAYPAPKPQLPPAVNPDNDPRFPFQGYLDAAPAGIDAEFAWGYDPPGGGAGGGDGGGAAIDLRFVDLEQGWVLDHEDLVAKGITLISGENLYYHYHGTAVLGEVTAVDNAIGCIGITPHLASVRVVSEWRDETTYDTADAILSALDVLNFGDVLLLEAQTDYNTYDKVPVEVHAAIFSAIRLGTALGVIIVEAAGNGANDLDEFSHAIYGQMLNRASDDFRDSGAIMVGAATSTVPHSRMSFSNYGSRIDCFAWGENVNTLTGSPGVTTNYTSTFNGTSSASPIVSGAALAVQGILHTNPGYRLGAYPMRALLSNEFINTLSADPNVDRIGVMPDLGAILGEALGLLPDIYIRDSVGDTGDPVGGVLSMSPDLILRSAPLPDPQAAFGEGSGSENNANLSENVTEGLDHNVYVRFRNRGGADAAGISATVYWSPPATLITPDLWNLIGSAFIPFAEADDSLVVSNAIPWLAGDIPGAGHYCLIGLIGTALDPMPNPADFLDLDNFRAFIRNNNNAAWRNFNVVENEGGADAEPPGFVQLPFLMPGAPLEPHRFHLEVIARLPRGSQLLLEAPLSFVEMLQQPYIKKFDPKKQTAWLALNPHGLWNSGFVSLAAKSRTRLRLLVAIPKKMRHKSYTVFARQMFEKDEVGRVTWRLVPAKEK